MKKHMELHFYSHISNLVSTYTQGERWVKVAEKTVQALNTDLGESYPDAFFYLKAKIKGGFKFYAGSVAEPGHWDDSRFKDIIQPLDASGVRLSPDAKRRKGN